MALGSSIGSVNAVAQASARNDSASFGLKNQNSSSERINAQRSASNRTSTNTSSVQEIKQRLDQSSSAEFGLKNQNSSAERINALRNSGIEFSDVYSTLNQIDSLDAKADHGLNDRNTTSERSGLVGSLQQRVVENHGFDAKESIKNKLTRNTKIVNIPPDQRGTIADLSA